MNAFAPYRTVEPSGSILSLEDAKAHLRVTHDDEDALIAALIAAAVSYLDGYSGILGCALLTQQWAMPMDCFPACDRMRLPLGPLGDPAQVSITYFDTADVEQSFTAFTPMTDAIGPVLVLDRGASWPAHSVRADAILVSWTCGFGDVAADVPANIILAIKLMLTFWFEVRDAMGNDMELPLGAKALLAGYRKVGL